MTLLQKKYADFIKESKHVAAPYEKTSNNFGYGPLIDQAAFVNIQETLTAAQAEGGK